MMVVTSSLGPPPSLLGFQRRRRRPDEHGLSLEMRVGMPLFEVSQSVSPELPALWLLWRGLPKLTVFDIIKE
jgi:hypothetical protein